MSIGLTEALVIERCYPHRPKRVFAAFSTAEAVSSWLSPADEIELHVEAFHFAPEGEFRFLYLMPPELPGRLAGRFLLIEPPNRLSFTWEWQPPDVHAGIETHVSIMIEQTDDGSRLTLEHRRLAAGDMPQRHIQGWAGALNRLDYFLERSQEGDLP